jgi:hypothetical protein
LTAIGKSIGQARIQLLEGCNAINNGDSNSALMHFNLVTRSLDNIEGNLTLTIMILAKRTLLLASRLQAAQAQAL